MVPNEVIVKIHLDKVDKAPHVLPGAEVVHGEGFFSFYLFSSRDSDTWRGNKLWNWINVGAVKKVYSYSKLPYKTQENNANIFILFRRLQINGLLKVNRRCKGHAIQTPLHKNVWYYVEGDNSLQVCGNLIFTFWVVPRQWHPTPVLLPGKSMDGGAW